VGLVVELDLFVMCSFLSAKFPGFFLTSKCISLIAKLSIAQIVVEIDDNPRGFEIFTDYVFLVDWAVEELFFGKFLVYIG